MPALPTNLSLQARDTSPAQASQLLTNATPDPNGYGRAVLVEVTVAATITFVFAEAGSTVSALSFTQTGVFEFNWSITQMTVNSGSARVWNLY